MAFKGNLSMGMWERGRNNGKGGGDFEGVFERNSCKSRFCLDM